MPESSVMIIPAAGLGTRLRSATPKVLRPVNGKPMVDHLLDLYAPVIQRFILVLHPSLENVVRAHCDRQGKPVGYARQETPTGMLDAILAPMEQVREARPARIWVTWCDQVAIHPETMRTVKRLSDEHPDAALILPTAQQPNPYIHIVRATDGHIVAIHHRREGDAMPEIGESDMGLFSLSPEAYFDRLVEFASGAGSGTATHERNFLPFIPWLSQRAADVRTFPCLDAREAIGINTADDLREIERYLIERDAPAPRA